MSNVDELVEKYIAIRDYISRLKQKHKEELLPYEVGLTSIEEELFGVIIELNVKNLKTANGTVYKQPDVSATVDDRPLFHSYVLETKGFHFLTSHVSKSAAKEYMEENNNVPPPGVIVTSFDKILVRRS